jgi:hypothetical protein
MQYLKNFPFFKNWAPREIVSFSYHFEHCEFNRDNYVYKQGSSGKYLYFINEGEFMMDIEVGVTKYEEKLKFENFEKF